MCIKYGLRVIHESITAFDVRVYLRSTAFLRRTFFWNASQSSALAIKGCLRSLHKGLRSFGTRTLIGGLWLIPSSYHGR